MTRRANNSVLRISREIYENKKNYHVCASIGVENNSGSLKKTTNKGNLLLTDGGFDNTHFKQAEDAEKHCGV